MFLNVSLDIPQHQGFDDQSSADDVSQHNPSSSPTRQYMKRIDFDDDLSVIIGNSTDEDSSDSIIVPVNPDTAAAAFLTRVSLYGDGSVLNVPGAYDSDGGSADSILEAVDPFSAAAAYLSNNPLVGDEDRPISDRFPALPNLAGDSDDGSIDSFINPIDPFTAAATFLANTPVTHSSPRVSQSISSGDISDSNTYAIDFGTAAAQFLSRPISPNNGEPNTIPDSDCEDSSSDLSIFRVNPDDAAAAFLSNNQEAAADSVLAAPSSSTFVLPIPDGPYTAEHFANVPDSWLVGM